MEARDVRSLATRSKDTKPLSCDANTVHNIPCRASWLASSPRPSCIVSSWWACPSLAVMIFGVLFFLPNLQLATAPATQSSKTPGESDSGGRERRADSGEVRPVSSHFWNSSRMVVRVAPRTWVGWGGPWWPPNPSHHYPARPQADKSRRMAKLSILVLVWAGFVRDTSPTHHTPDRVCPSRLIMKLPHVRRPCLVLAVLFASFPPLFYLIVTPQSWFLHVAVSQLTFFHIL